MGRGWNSCNIEIRKELVVLGVLKGVITTSRGAELLDIGIEEMRDMADRAFVGMLAKVSNHG